MRRFFGFSRNRSGAAAVEFALVAPLFFSMLFSAVEIGWTMCKVMMLDRAMEQTVRELRIGRPGGFTHGDVRSELCRRAFLFSACESNLIVELIPVAIGAALPADGAVCVDRSATVAPTIRFDAGKPSELMFIRACAVTDPLTPGLGLGLRLSPNPGNGYFIVSRSTFLNEPSS